MPRFICTRFVFYTILLLTLTYSATQPAEAQTFTVLHNFTGGEDGQWPYAGVTLDRAGNLYGTASHGADGGGSGQGTAYKLTHAGSGWTFNTLFAFESPGGWQPQARIIFGPDGALYGTTFAGGSNGNGTVYNLRPNPTACPMPCPWTATFLHGFGGDHDGSYPTYGDIIFDQAHNIYGTALGGGDYGYGVVYELTSSGTESVLYSFSGTDGGMPYGGVTFDNAGNLYGTTSEGGLSGYGTVFALTYAVGVGWTEHTLYNFTNGSDGSYPIAGLIFDQSGNLYGATINGGSGGGGTVFELSPSNGSWTLNTIYSFTGYYANSNCGPESALVMDGAGNLYGATACDGANDFGSVFMLTLSNGIWSQTVLHDFTGGGDGGNPYCQVAFDTRGNLYGTTFQGGTLDLGVVWEITP